MRACIEKKKTQKTMFSAARFLIALFSHFLSTSMLIGRIEKWFLREQLDRCCIMSEEWWGQQGHCHMKHYQTWVTILISQKNFMKLHNFTFHGHNSTPEFHYVHARDMEVMKFPWNWSENIMKISCIILRQNIFSAYQWILYVIEVFKENEREDYSLPIPN